MANRTKSVLKGYFETGDTPSQAQYADLIDSQLNLSETTAQTIVGPTILTSGVTASAGISSSGDLISKDLYIDQYIKHTGDTNTHINFTDDRIRFDVGGISYIDLNDSTSAPHDITFNDGGNNVDFTIKGTSNNPLFATDASAGRIGTNGIGTPLADVHIGGNLLTDSHITASGNISASFTSTGSFGSAMLTNLPTVEPLVSGALWLSGSGGGSASGSKYLMVFNG